MSLNFASFLSNVVVVSLVFSSYTIFLLFLHLTIYFTVLSNVYRLKPNKIRCFHKRFSFITIPVECAYANLC